MTKRVIALIMAAAMVLGMVCINNRSGKVKADESVIYEVTEHNYNDTSYISGTVNPQVGKDYTINVPVTGIVFDLPTSIIGTPVTTQETMQLYPVDDGEGNITYTTTDNGETPQDILVSVETHKAWSSSASAENTISTVTAGETAYLDTISYYTYEGSAIDGLPASFEQSGSISVVHTPVKGLGSVQKSGTTLSVTGEDVYTAENTETTFYYVKSVDFRRVFDADAEVELKDKDNLGDDGDSYPTLSALNTNINLAGDENDGYYSVYQIITIPDNTLIYFNGEKADRDFYLNNVEISATDGTTTGFTYTNEDPTKTISIYMNSDDEFNYSVTHPATGEGPDPSSSSGLVPASGDETVTIQPSVPKDFAGKSDTYTIKMVDPNGNKVTEERTLTVTYDEGKPTITSLTVGGSDIAIDGTGVAYANKNTTDMDLTAVVSLSGTAAKLKSGKLNDTSLTADADAKTLTGSISAETLSEGENDFKITAESTYDIPMDNPVEFKAFKDTKEPVIRQSKNAVSQDGNPVTAEDEKKTTYKVSSLKDTEIKIWIDDLSDETLTADQTSGVDPDSITIDGYTGTITPPADPSVDNFYTITIDADSNNSGTTKEYKVNAMDKAGNAATERTIKLIFFEEDADIEVELNEKNKTDDGFIIWSGENRSQHKLEFNYTVTSEVELTGAEITYSVDGKADDTHSVALGTPTVEDGKYVYKLKDDTLDTTDSILLNSAKLVVTNVNGHTTTEETQNIKVDVKSPTDIAVTGYDSDWHQSVILTITASDDSDGTGVYSGVKGFYVKASNYADGALEKDTTYVPGDSVTFSVPESKDGNGTKISIKAEDNAMNPTSEYVDGSGSKEIVCYVDKTNPDTKLWVNGKDYKDADGQFYKKAPTIKFDANDIPSGITTKGVKVTISYEGDSKVFESDTVTDNEAYNKSLNNILKTDALAGNYTVDYVVTDKAGNKIKKSTTFTMDQVKPKITINRTPDASKGITGYYKENVKLEIIVEDDNIPKAEGYLTVTENDEVYNVNWQKTSTGWRAIASFPDEGKHDIKVSAKDKANNKSSDTNFFVVDRTEPVITTTLNGSTYDGMDKYLNTTGEVDVSVTDDTEDPKDMVAAIEYTDPATGLKDTEVRDLKKASTAVAYPKITCSKNGRYEISFVSTDKCGNASEKTIAFTVDNEAPKNNMFITASKPAKFSKYQNAYSNKLGKFGDDKEAYTYGQYYAANVGIDLKVADYNVGSITVTDNGTALSPTWSYSNGINSASITISSEGYHEIKIKSVDKAGNVTEDSGNTQKLIFVIDKTAPVISLALNSAGYADGSGVRYLTSDGYVDVSVSDTNKDTDDLTRVTLTTPPGSGQSSSTEYVGEGTHTFTTEADYEIHYVAVDRAGNKSAERVMTFRVDKTAPQLTISSSAGGGTATGAVTVTFSMNEAFYNDVRSGEIKVYKKIDGQGESLLETIEFKPKSASDSLSKTYSEDGEYRFEFTAQDMAGNVASPAQHSFILDGTAPIITLSGVKNYDITDKNVTLGVTIDEAFYTTNNVVLNGTREDIDGKVEKLKFEDVAFNRGKLTNFEKIFKEDGIYDIEVSSTDKAGNKDEKSVHFTIDTTAPEIGDLSKYDGTVLNKFEWNEDLDKLVKDLTVCDITIYLDGVEYDGMSDIEDGTHVLKIVATDEMKHTTTKEYTFLLDTKGPNIIVSGIEEGQRVVDPTDIAVSVQLDEDTLDTVQLNGKAIDVADNEAKLTVNKKGSYTITATAHDEAGNNSSVELHFNYGSKINWLLIAIIGGGVLLIAIILLLLLRRRKDS